jgi:ABC-type transport system substrate-binding protein
MNAAAIAWNLDMYKKTAMFTATTNFWKSWDIIDDYTIRVNFTQWRNTLMRAWENYFFVSPSAYTKNGIEWMRTHMVGTGPFMQTDYQKDVSISFVKNPNYWQRDDQGNLLPYLDKVQLLYVADETTRENLMKTGGGEMLNSSTKQAGRFNDTSKYTIVTKSGGPTMLVPDSKNADSPYAKLQVRLAVELAIDRVALSQNFGYGFDKPAFQLSSSNTKAYDPAIIPRSYDEATAKDYLKQAGYPNGFDTTIYVAPGSTKEPVVAIQQYLAKVGIKATLEYPQPAAWQAITTQPTKVNSLVYIPLNEWSNYNTTLNVFFSGLGFYLPSNKKPDGYAQMFDNSLNAPTVDPALLKIIADAFFVDCTIIPLVYSTFVFVLTPNVMDSGLTKYGMQNEWDYSHTWLKK